jgi:hypothetical protein
MLLHSVKENGRLKGWDGGVADTSERKRLYKGEFISIRPKEGIAKRWGVM